MEDRVKLGNGTDVTIRFGDIPTNVDTVGELLAYLEAGASADIEASNTATVAGTPLNKASLLDDDTAESLNLDGEDATVNNALKATRPISQGGTGETTKAAAQEALSTQDCFFAVCSTAAATAAKVVGALTGFELRAGVSVYVVFSATNTAASPTLAVSGTGAKALTDLRGGALIANGSFPYANIPYLCMYDGTRWRIISSTAVMVSAGTTNAWRWEKWILPDGTKRWKGKYSQLMGYGETPPNTAFSAATIGPRPPSDVTIDSTIMYYRDETNGRLIAGTLWPDYAVVLINPTKDLAGAGQGRITIEMEGTWA